MRHYRRKVEERGLAKLDFSRRSHSKVGLVL